jgi:hypothetical protein
MPHIPNLPANRVAAIFAVVAGVLGALAPIIADIDTASAAGLIAGLLAIVATVDRFLKGSQAHERAQADANAAHRDVVDGAESIASIEDPEAEDVPLEDLPDDDEEFAAPPPVSERDLDKWGGA